MHWTLPRSSYCLLVLFIDSRGPRHSGPLKRRSRSGLRLPWSCLVFCSPWCSSSSRMSLDFKAHCRVSRGDGQPGNCGQKRKWTTTKHSLYLCVVKFAAQLGDCQLVSQRSRDVNVEADALTNNDLSVCNPVLRLSTEGIRKHLICLPSLAETAKGFKVAGCCCQDLES